MKNIIFNLSVFSFVSIASVSTTFAMNNPNPQLTPRSNLLTILRELSNEAATHATAGNPDQNDHQALAHMIVDRRSNYAEPAEYLTRINTATMTQSYWMDLVQYLGGLNRHGQRDEDAIDYARTFAYAPLVDDDE